MMLRVFCQLPYIVPPFEHRQLLAVAALLRRKANGGFKMQASGGEVSDRFADGSQVVVQWSAFASCESNLPELTRLGESIAIDERHPGIEVFRPLIEVDRLANQARRHGLGRLDRGKMSGLRSRGPALLFGQLEHPRRRPFTRYIE